MSDILPIINAAPQATKSASSSSSASASDGANQGSSFDNLLTQQMNRQSAVSDQKTVDAKAPASENTPASTQKTQTTTNGTEKSSEKDKPSADATAASVDPSTVVTPQLNLLSTLTNVQHPDTIEATVNAAVDVTANPAVNAALNAALNAKDIKQTTALSNEKAATSSLRSTDPLNPTPVDAQAGMTLAPKIELDLKQNAMPKAEFKLPVNIEKIEKAAAPLTEMQTPVTPLTTTPPAAPMTELASTQAIPTVSLSPPVATADWNNALGQKVVWMAGSQQHIAELHLNPPDLGPMQIVLSVNNDQASALFIAQHPDTRQAIEAALPRLTQIMAENGIVLGDATVAADRSQQQAGFDRRGEQGGRQGNDASQTTGGLTITGTEGVRVYHNGLVDTFV